MRRDFIRLWPLLAALCIVFPGSHILAQAEKGPDTAREVAKARLDAARAAFDKLVAAQRNGAPMDPELRFRWSQRILGAECDLAKDQASIVAAYKGHLDRMIELERITGNFVKTGVLRTYEGSAANYFRLDAEERLLRARQKK